MARVFTAYIEYDQETKLYVGIVPSISGAHTQGENLKESEGIFSKSLIFLVKRIP
jgi:predicted RNase H-like HicB family nuclease